MTDPVGAAIDAAEQKEEVPMREIRGAFPSGRPFTVIVPADLTPDEGAALGVDIIRGAFQRRKPPGPSIVVPRPALPKRLA